MVLVISESLDPLARPLIRPLAVRHTLLRPLLGLSIDRRGGVLFSRFRKGDGHPDGIPFLFKFHGVLLVMLAYLPISLFNIRARKQTSLIYLVLQGNQDIAVFSSFSALRCFLQLLWATILFYK
jgi:hypothetical protein